MPQTPAQRVAANVRAELARADKSQEDAAAELRVSRSAFGRRMTGEVPFDVVELDRLAAFLDVPVTHLVEVRAVATKT